MVIIAILVYLVQYSEVSSIEPVTHDKKTWSISPSREGQ